jgi:hypothetical protein
MQFGWLRSAPAERIKSDADENGNYRDFGNWFVWGHDGSNCPLSLMGANAQNARTAQGGARRVEEDLSAESLFITTYRMKIRQP